MTQQVADARTAPEHESRGHAVILVILAVTAAVAVAGQYYIQPLLSVVAYQFGVPEGVAALLVTATQVGFVVGLVFLVPLGDLVQHRRLLPALLTLAAVALAACGVAPGFWALAAASVAVGVSAAAAQVAVPLAGHLVPPGFTGRATGIVMSGLMLGILLARTASGVIAGAFGWRAVFFVAAGVELALALVLWFAVPRTRPSTTLRYPALLKSVVELVISSPVLRSRMLLGGISMCGFSVLWTSLAFLLAGNGSAYHFDEATIGLFGLVGAAGALAAPIVGHIADGGRATLAATVAWLLVIAGWAGLAWGTTSLVGLIIGLLVFDFGAQAIQLSNQHAIYGTHPDARSRVTTAYMSAYFVGAVVGSVVSGFTYQLGGWPAVCALGAAVATAGLVTWAVTARTQPAA